MVRGNVLDDVEFHRASDSDAGLHIRVSRVLRDGDGYRLLLPAGTPRLVVRREGYFSESITPNLVSDRLNRVELTLRRAP